MRFQEKLATAQGHLSASDPKMAVLIRQWGDCQLRPHGDHYAELVSSIVSQQLSVKAAASIWQRVLVLSGGNPPTPQQLAAISPESLRSCGLSRPKVTYVKDLARHILDGKLDMQHIAALPNQEVIAQLTAVKGIGEWSAHMFLIFSLGRLDILPVGDLGIRKAAKQVYGLRQLPDTRQLIKLAKQNGWHPYETVASWYLWEFLDNKPAQPRH